ncbi:MAG: hypothetical protein PHY64_14220 [Eubacteriales bacterium]|nr:hypothetical protein [Eubacteriales bacterium]
MRKMIMIGLVLALILSLPLSAMGEATMETSTLTMEETTVSPTVAPDIVINENSFLYQIGRMNENPAAYVGQTVQIEGMFGAFHYGDEDHLQTYYMVYRYFEGNNCCAADVTGLEVYWPQDDAVYPQENDWVRTEGVLETYELDGTTYLQARLTALETLEESGEALVTE